MLFYVFQLRQLGNRQPLRQVIERAVRAEVLYLPYENDQFGRGAMVARLQARDGRTAIELLPARLVRMSTAIQISGTETHTRGTKSRPMRYRQTWLCTPTEQLGREILQKWQPPRSVTGFDDDDD